MKYGNVAKSSDSGGQASYSPEIMGRINKFTRRELTADEVYVFPVVMCDNELDRDYERFSAEALYELAEKFIGKTVICDHNRKNENQTARIFSTKVVRIPSVKTFDGEDLHQLTGMCYMLKNAENQGIIDNIDAGIYREVSVGCSVSSQKCSICGAEYMGGECPHYRGNIYEGKRCYLTLANATDAYELSFVAVPAQPGAGVTKWYKGDDSAKKKGLKNNMDYNEAKKALADIGVDLDGIAKTKGDLPPISDILAAVSKAFSEKCTSSETFITAEEVKSAAGKDMSSDDVLGIIKNAEKTAEKAKLYDDIKSKSVDNAVKSGIKAKGDSFSEERYRKIFESFSVDEINAQAAEWETEAKKALNPGRTSEDVDKGSNSVAISNLDEYKF